MGAILANSATLSCGKKELRISSDLTDCQHLRYLPKIVGLDTHRFDRLRDNFLGCGRS